MEVLGERIRELEMEKEGLAQGRARRSVSIQRTPERETTQGPREVATTPSQIHPAKPKE